MYSSFAEYTGISISNRYEPERNESPLDPIGQRRGHLEMDAASRIGTDVFH